MARAPLRAGDPVRIGHYRLTARLGSGGMGVVYLGVGWDGSQVAVKVLRPELADDHDFRRRFRREVSALLRVKGVCTVRVIEADTESPRPFMVTEYAEGPSLAEYIDHYGLLGPDMLYGLATGLAEALTVIHAAGIVHRDLKPSNVILTDAGPKVIDFGIAQALDAMSMTKTGMMVGSPGFMAPEQISGHPGQAADVFVWGVTVAYAATGQSPFGTGETHAVLYRVLHADPGIAAVPDPLRPLVAAALAKDPDRRPTAQQLLDRLTSLSMRSPRPQDSPTQTILSRTWQQTGPHPSRPRAADEPRGAKGSLLLDPASPGAGPTGAGAPGARKRRVSRRTTTIGVSALAAAAVAVGVVLVVLPGHAPKEGPSANEGNPGAANPVATNTQWTPVTVPVDHGAETSIAGVSFDGAGLIAVRPGKTTSGADDGVAYFSPDGRTWQYAGTIDAAGGWSPDVVKGSDYGFVVTGHTPNQYVAYTSPGTGTRWLPTGPLGSTSGGPGFTTAVGPGGSVVAAGSTNPGKTSQQALLIKADTAGDLEPVSLTAIPGGFIPEEAVKSIATAGNVQIAAGSADGYPAVWRRVSDGPWALVSSLAQVSADPDLAGLSAVTHGPHGWLAAGPGLVLTSADGTNWRSAGAITRDLAGVSAVQAASGPRGYVIAGPVAGPGGAPARDVWWSADLSGWTRAQDQNETDGSNQVLTWQLVPFSAPGPGISFTALTAAAGGFTAAAQFGPAGGTTDAAVWTSADGTSWTRSPVSGLTGGGSHALTALAGSGAAVTGIDSVQAQASQQFIARRLPAG